MTLAEYHSHKDNIKCQNLCTNAPHPTNIKKILRLGRKLHIQS